MLNSNPLEQLKAIHLPDAIGLWPPAPGWFFLFFIFISAGFLFFIYWSKNKTHFFYKKTALTKLTKLKQSSIKQNDTELIRDLSTLLRRTSLACFPREEVASLRGKEWLLFLDQTADTNEFSKGIGRILITAPYQKNINFDHEKLFELIESWVIKNV